MELRFEDLTLEEQVDILKSNKPEEIGLNLDEYHSLVNAVLDRINREIDELIFERARWDEDEYEYRRLDAKIEHLSKLYNQLSEELPMFGWMKVSLHSFFFIVFFLEICILKPVYTLENKICNLKNFNFVIWVMKG